MSDTKKLKIFVVDDDPAMSEMIKDFIYSNYEGFTVFVYPTAEKALDELYHKPHIIILDYYLDSVHKDAINGMQALKKFKQRIPSLPVIFLSAQNNPEVSANTIKLGAYDYIVKDKSAFHRLEIILNNLSKHFKLEKNVSTQKFFNVLLAILFFSAIVGIIAERIF